MRIVHIAQRQFGIASELVSFFWLGRASVEPGLSSLVEGR
jgi:hypothetical protein